MYVYIHIHVLFVYHTQYILYKCEQNRQHIISWLTLIHEVHKFQNIFFASHIQIFKKCVNAFFIYILKEEYDKDLLKYFFCSSSLYIECCNF